MANKLDDLVNRTFESSKATKNPLRTEMKPAEKRVLVALLLLYGCPEPEELSSALKGVGQIGDEAAALANRIRSKVFGVATAKKLSSRANRRPSPASDIEKGVAEVTAPLVPEFRDLPDALDAFAEKIHELTNNVAGKRGYEGTVLKNRLLIMASEYARRCTGSYCDQRLAELMLAILPDPSGCGEKDFSEDLIHKKREHFKKFYPLIYAHVMEEVDRMRPVTVWDLRAKKHGKTR